MAEGRFRRTLAGVLAVPLLISLVVALPGPEADGAGTNPVVPEYGALLGMYGKPKDGDWTKAGVQRRFNKLESLAGRSFDIGHYYYGFTAAFPTWRERWHRDNGRVPLVSWDARTSTQVTAGQHDATIRARADNVKAHQDPVLIRYGWEMSEGVNHAAAGSASEFKAAWKHIVSIFRSRGANNAQFVWCPTAWAFHTGRAQQYYPGDDCVDWICADGYNWAPRKAGDPWRGFGEIFDAFYSWGAPRNKPLMVGEFGVQEGTAGRKANWFRAVPQTLQNEYPDIKAIVYFDSDNPYPWWMDTSSSAVAGFKDMALDPYLNDGLAFQSGFDHGFSDFPKKKNVTIDNAAGRRHRFAECDGARRRVCRLPPGQLRRRLRRDVRGNFREALSRLHQRHPHEAAEQQSPSDRAPLRETRNPRALGPHRHVGQETRHGRHALAEPLVRHRTLRQGWARRRLAGVRRWISGARLGGCQRGMADQTVPAGSERGRILCREI